MRLHELVPVSADLVVYNEETGHTMVLTSAGAVFDTEDTSDLRNISIAFGLLVTSDAWRAAIKEEIDELRLRPPVRMMELSWAIPKPKPRPKLEVVSGGRFRENTPEEEATIMAGALADPDAQPWTEEQLAQVKFTRRPARVVYEKDGMKIYDDDDTQ